MQQTSELYKSILSDPNHWAETRLTIGESGRLCSERGDVITFGGVSILVADGGPDSGYDEHSLISMKTHSQVFKGAPSAGNAIAAEIDIEMLKPTGGFARQARLAPYVRLTDGERFSEWLHKGIFFVDTREHEHNPYGDEERLIIHGYDAMLKAEEDYPSSGLAWPARDIDVIREIAQTLQVSVDPRTFETVNHGYPINYPAMFSMREVLSNIAALYGANALMSDQGELWIAKLAGVPPETRLLCDELGYVITFGGDRIRV